MELVETQIKSVEKKNPKGIQVCYFRNTFNVKVLFLVGGLGSNRFLANFIRNRVSKGIVVMQPDAAYVSRKDEIDISDIPQS